MPAACGLIRWSLITISNHTTAFTVSIDYKPGMTTGISAEERTICCRALANPNAGASDFARPGHIFPLIARDGGVLLRSGHTYEAAVDLCKLCDLPPVGVISELMNDDGTVMKGEQVVKFAAKHNLKHVTIADMISYRQAREKLIERVSTFTRRQPDRATGRLCLSFPVRSDLSRRLRLQGCRQRPERADALSQAQHREGYFSSLRPRARCAGTFQKERQRRSGLPARWCRRRTGAPIADDHSAEADRNRQWREVGVGAQILRDLGVTSIRHLTSSAHDYKGLSGFGIEIVANEPFEG